MTTKTQFYNKPGVYILPSSPPSREGRDDFKLKLENLPHSMSDFTHFLTQIGKEAVFLLLIKNTLNLTSFPSLKCEKHQLENLPYSLK